MRRRKKRKIFAPQIAIIAVMLLTVPAAVNFARANAGFLQNAGVKAAIASAAVNMPEGGINLIRERFRAELYGDDTEGAQNEDKDSEHPPVENHNPQPVLPPEEESEATPGKSSEKTIKPPRIPDKYAAALVSENFAGRPGGTLISTGTGFIKNDTEESDEDIAGILEGSFDLGLTDTAEPQVLLFHTHATESFERYDSDVYDTRNTWRSTDNNNNMAAVGSAMQQALEENGVNVLHDTTQHDYPSYNGSYERSAETIKKYLDEYPSIKIVLDIHRDAMQRDNQSIVKPVAMINGKKAAQIMIIAGCDDGTMDMQDWPRNLRFAAAFQNKMEDLYPDLTRPIYFCYRKYNMDLSDGSLLLEFGSNANTLDEAVYSAGLAGKALADLIKEASETTQGE